MALTKINLEFNKTYATEANAEKAVAKVMDGANLNGHNIRYTIIRTPDGRYAPLFIGMNCLQVGIHFHFSVIA